MDKQEKIIYDILANKIPSIECLEKPPPNCADCMK